MRRETPERLRDIIEAAEAVDHFRPADRALFDSDIKGQLALTRLVEIIGEAANHVSTGVRDAHPEVPWREIIGMRHRVTHAYFEVDLDVLWVVVTIDVPRLASQIKAILDALDES